MQSDPAARPPPIPTKPTCPSWSRHEAMAGANGDGAGRAITGITVAQKDSRLAFAPVRARPSITILTAKSDSSGRSSPGTVHKLTAPPGGRSLAGSPAKSVTGSTDVIRGPHGDLPSTDVSSGPVRSRSRT